MKKFKVTRSRKPVNDISGKRFGKLVAQEYDLSQKQSSWKCVCDCGNVTTVLTCNLVRGNTKSCGCLRDKMYVDSVENLAGRRFGRLFVLHKASIKTRSKKTMWNCLCSCGKVRVIAAASLIRGSTTSCGCFQKDQVTKAATTHGMSKTQQYISMMNRKRKEYRKLYDASWTIEMENFIHIYFTSCVVCGEKNDLTVDHVIPLSKGGGLVPGNATILCRSCNSAKNTKLLKQLDKQVSRKIKDSAKRFEYAWNIVSSDKYVHPHSPVNYGWASNYSTYEWRKFLKEKLLLERGSVSDFSGNRFDPHDEIEMHEGIISRAIVPKSLWWQIFTFHPYNSFLVTREEHEKYGHFREWALQRSYELYGRENVIAWFNNLPFKVRPFKLL